MHSKRVVLWMAFLACSGSNGPALAQEKDFVPLFNGKDLAGWKTHPEDPEGNWRVEDGVLVASGKVLKPHCLFTNRADYRDCHFFVEARINDGGNSGQYFRCKFGPGINPGGYEAQINSTHPDQPKTGSLYGRGLLANVSDNLVKPGDWFTQEVIAQGNRIIIKVNGKTTVDYVDQENRFSRGHLALQLHSPKVTRIEFRAIKVKELSRDPSGPLADRITTQTVDLTEGVKYAYRGGRPNRSNLVLAPFNDGYRLGWTDLKGNTHVSSLSGDFKLAGKDVTIPDLDLRGLEVHDDGAMGLMAAELPLRMCVLRLGPTGKEEFRTVLTGAKGDVLKEQFLDNIWCFSGRLVASPTEYAAHFNHGWRTEPTVVHTGGYFGRVDFKGKLVKEDRWTVSHSLDQRVLYHDNAFLTLSLGDAFPVGVYFENRMTRKNVLSYPPPELKAKFDPRVAMHLGSMVPAGPNVAVAFMQWAGESKVLTYQLLSPDAKVLTSVKLHEAPKSAPHVVRLAPYGANLLLAWQEDKETSKLVVIDYQGRVVNTPTVVPEPLPDNDELVVLSDGDVGWVLATHGDPTVRFIRVAK